jgi:hypothetical protein
VVVIDAKNFTIETTIDLGFGPNGIAIPPNGSEAYVVDDVQSVLAVIDTKTLSVVTALSVPEGTRRIEVNTNGHLGLATTQYSSDAALIDLIEREVIGTVHLLEGSPWGVAFEAGHTVQRDLLITTPSLADGWVGEEYRQTLLTNTTGVEWSVSAGELPAGLALDVDGNITGTPITVGESTVTFKVTDPNTGASAYKAFTLRIFIDPEMAIGSAYNTWFNGVYNYGGPSMFLSTQAFQHNSPWANAGMLQYGQLPRVGIVNDSADPYYRFFTRPWHYAYDVIEGVKDGLWTLEESGIAGGYSEEELARFQAFGTFNRALALATVAVFYHQGFAESGVLDPAELLYYPSLMQVAIDHFDEAIALSSASSFSLPFHWMAADVTSEDLARLASSYKARFYAAHARTPEEREALNWPAIISWVDAGIQDDFMMHADPNAGWYLMALDYSVWPTWAQMAYWMYGMADQSGNYQEWLALPMVDKLPHFEDGREVLIVTPDLRFPQGATVDEQRDSPGAYHEVLRPEWVGNTWKRPDRGTWHWSWYKNTRMLEYGWDAVYDQPEMRMAEMDFLEAEGHMRTGNLLAAANIVNAYRVFAGLNATDPFGTNTSCVPRLPDGSCGDLWEMLKWEKRMEIAHTGIAGVNWFFDSRGWGDLWKDTPLQFPMPCDELTAMGMMCYTFGGPGGDMSAPISSYGFNEEW